VSDLLGSLAEGLAGAAAAAVERRRLAARAVPWRLPAREPTVVAAQAPQPATDAGQVTPVIAPAEPIAVPRAEPPADPPPRLDVRQLLDGPRNLLRTIFATEVISLPLALRRHNLWDGPSV
jgi:hypothetical protein